MIPIVRALERRRPGTVLLFDTQQQRELTPALLSDYDLCAVPIVRIDCQRYSLASQLASQLMQLDDRIAGCVGVVVQGDTTSTVAGALAGFYRGLPVVHVEAGLRSHDVSQPFPEEMNRRLVSEIASLHLAPTKKARTHLLDCGINADSVAVVGNPLVDLCREVDGREPAPWDVLITMHRRENRASGIKALCRALDILAKQNPLCRFAVIQHSHPDVHGRFIHHLPRHANLVYIAPMTHRVFLKALSTSKLVMTDSGGVQEEAAMLGVATLILRNVLDREDGIAAGSARLVGTQCDEIVIAANQVLHDNAHFKPAGSIGQTCPGELIASRILAYYALDQESAA
jgi:UDP-N-acetylglucosamine 2-epimerase (non-hydrolysing)